jgi:hypothetical protein
MASAHAQEEKKQQNCQSHTTNFLYKRRKTQKHRLSPTTTSSK